MRKILVLAVLTLGATSALADEAGQALTYEQFEAAVPHVDLAECPATLAAEDRFCRATLLHDQINVFAFSQDGSQPMVGFGAWAPEGLSGLLN